MAPWVETDSRQTFVVKATGQHCSIEDGRWFFLSDLQPSTFCSSHHQMGVLFLPGFVGHNAQVWMDRVLYPLVSKQWTSHNEAFLFPRTSKTLHYLRLVASFIYSLRTNLNEWRWGAEGSGRGRRTLIYKQFHNIQFFFTSCTGKNLKSSMLCSVGKAVGKRALTYFWCEYKFVQPIWRAFGNNHKNYKCMYPFSQ